MRDITLVIEPGRSEENYWRDLWDYRELFLVLAWRDIAVRYKQTMIGIAWAILRPLLTMAVFTVIFGRLAQLPSDGRSPYALMVLAGMLPWFLFSSSLASAADSIISNASLIGKIYFPRIIIPAAAMAATIIDFAISLVILFGTMFWYQHPPSWRLSLLPFFVLLAVVASAGLGLWITSLNAKYRDFRYLLPFLLQLGLYISPVGFSSAVVPAEWRLIYSLNPIVGVIDGFRWCVLGAESPLYLPGLILSAGVTAVLLWFGVGRFRSTEKTFADLL